MIVSEGLFADAPAPAVQTHRADQVTIEIGKLAIALQTKNDRFRELLESRYAGFVNPSAQPQFCFDVHIIRQRPDADVPEVIVRRESGNWRVERGDFCASWSEATHSGWVRQSCNPYSIDTLLRIVHSIALAEEGSFLVHSSSAIRHGRAFLFAGVSGAGKTTMARLAPCDATLLTDEMSYVCREAGGYRAYGTPFAGELARPGENTSAPLAEIYLLAQGPENRIEDVPTAEAARGFLRHILFLTQEEKLVQQVFRSALEFVSAVPVRRLTFTKDSRAWELIQ
ncbi:MAG: hypothetical protein ACRD50_05610 [Candidatus Acidiferrales bacterium]